MNTSLSQKKYSCNKRFVIKSNYINSKWTAKLFSLLEKTTIDIKHQRL